jgi:hypothetical protein
MTTREQQARIYNEAVAQGLSEDAALKAAGITNPDSFNFGTNGQLEPTRVGPPRRANETIVPANVSIDAGDDEDTDRQFVTRPVSNQTTTTNQDTVTGGSVRTTTVAPTTYRDTAQSSALKGQADSLTAQKEARAAELRAQGKTGAEILRDPQYKTLSREAQATEYAAQDARAVDQAGTVSTTTSPGQGQVFQQTPNSQFLTDDTAGDDAQVNAQDANRFSTSGELPRSFSAGDVTDTGGVPTQSLTDIEDPGFVPQAEPAFIPPGFSPYGEEDDPFDPDLVTEAEDVEFADDYLSSGDFASLEAAQAREAEAFAREEPDDGISPYGEADDEFDPDLATEPGAVTDDPQVDPNGPPFDDDGNLNPGFTLDGDGNVIFVGDDFVDPSLTASAEASRAAARQQATLDNARKQATIQSQRKQGNDTDWRVRLSLAPQSTYLYNAPDVAGQPGSGILAPLKRTNGVIFPYTPRITTAYVARYNNYDLTHSNYRGYFYQGSHIEDINIEATFTAQDTAEAEYLLAVIHFFRSVTKMFYGQDAQRGTPPPLVYLRGLGEFQYNLHPCVVSQFNYNLPPDVDYIRARSKNTIPPGLLQRRQRETVPTNIFSSALARLSAAGVPKGAEPAPPPVVSLGVVDASYVPTKLDMQIVLKPMQSREQVSRQFSLKQYANGDLLKGGFW